MHKIKPDQLSIIAYGEENKPSDDIRKFETVCDQVFAQLEKIGYQRWIQEDGMSCWILQPGEKWRRGKLRLVLEVHVEDDRTTSPNIQIETDNNTSPLDDLRNLNDEQP